MAPASEVDKTSYAELTDMEAQIQRLKVEKLNTERVALRQKLTDEAKKHGYSIQDLFGRGRKGKGTVAVKYRDPKNRTNTWTVEDACHDGWQPQQRAVRRRKKTSSFEGRHSSPFAISRLLASVFVQARH